VRREHVECHLFGWRAQRVCVAADEEGPGDALLGAILDDRLRDGEDVRLVERRRQARAAVPRGAEGDALRRFVDVRNIAVVGADEVINVDEVFGKCNCAGSFMHGFILTVFGCNRLDI